MNILILMSKSIYQNHQVKKKMKGLVKKDKNIFDYLTKIEILIIKIHY